MSSPVWKWLLVKTSNLEDIIADLTTGAHSKNLQLMLNNAGTATFWMHLEDKRTAAIEEHKTALICYRNNKPIWSGEIFKCVEDADNSQNSTLQVTALGWFELLNKRIVHTGFEWEAKAVRTSGREVVIYNPGELPHNPTKEQREAWEKEYEEKRELTFAGVKKQYEEVLKEGEEHKPGCYEKPEYMEESALELYYGKLEEPFGIPRNIIAADLINRANIDVPTGITLGTNPVCSSVNFTVPRFHPVGEFLTQLTSIENSFDFDIDPLTRKFNIFYNQVKADSTIYGLGQDRGPGVRFTFPGNCVKANRASDGTKTRNRTYAVGPYGVGEAESVESVNELGLFEASEDLTDTPNINILKAYAEAQTTFFERPFKVVTFEPRAVTESSSYSVPKPFEDYEIGDIVYTQIKKGPRFVLGYGTEGPQATRIFGMTVEISDTGTEKISNLQTVYSNV